MEPGKEVAFIESRTWAVPGPSLSLDALIATLRFQGTKILEVDRQNNRVLVSYERS